MKYQLEEIQKGLRGLRNESSLETHILYPGIELSFLTIRSDSLSMSHHAPERIMEINHCRTGPLGWKMKNGNNVYLGPGDYSLHTMKSCAGSTMTLPNGYYEGITLCIDLNQLSPAALQLPEETGITGGLLYHKFCEGESFTSLAGSSESESIFSSFYGQPEHLKTAYWKIKTLELLLYLTKLQISPREQLTEYQSEQVEIIRGIHQYLITHLDQRFTIESLSRQYLMNPTTLKTTFKAVYGTSIAAHIKFHRMEQAAKLLLETNATIAQIAAAVGYDNQSKFAGAFKEYFQVLPSEYRRLH